MLADPSPASLFGDAFPHSESAQDFARSGRMLPPIHPYSYPQHHPNQAQMNQMNNQSSQYYFPPTRQNQPYQAAQGYQAPFQADPYYQNAPPPVPAHRASFSDQTLLPNLDLSHNSDQQQQPTRAREEEEPEKDFGPLLPPEDLQPDRKGWDEEVIAHRGAFINLWVRRRLSCSRACEAE